MAQTGTTFLEVSNNLPYNELCNRWATAWRLPIWSTG